MPPEPRRKAQPSASFHDDTARQNYSARFRPIAISAVAAGTRRAAPALSGQKEDIPSRLAGVLRRDFDDQD